MQLTDLPHLNVILNAATAVLLTAGYIAIRRGRVIVHRNIMIAAMITAAAFLTSYLTYHFGVRLTKKYEGPWGWFYYPTLLIHVVGAMVNAPMVVMTATRAFRGQFPRHVRIARLTLPLWWFVSVTGVIVYFMLY
ncbi:MAG TPA: DUF420 domain-containing protein [Phycisphaerae bacterium]|nr:DUF420 domain-containing protein [Phycisphaerales bacterium]HRX84956.1 DUF420 domain-containing protein [Phycisphaerae bacterium]